MGQQMGIGSKIIYDESTTFKVTKTSPDAWVLPFASESLKLNRNLVESKVIRTTRNSSMPSRGLYEISGDINTELNPTMGRLFKHTLGTCATTGGNPYTHTFTISSLPTGLVFEKSFTNIAIAKYFLYTGCKINSMKLSIKPEGPVEVTYNIMGAKEYINSASFDSTSTDQGHLPFDGYEVSVSLWSTGYEGGSNLLAQGTEVDMTIDNGLDGNTYVLDGTGERYSLPDGMVKVSGTVKALFTDSIIYSQAISHTECYMSIRFTKGTGVGTAGNEYLEIRVPEIILQPSAPVISGPTGILVELPYVAYYNNSSEISAVQFILKNAIASW